MDSQIAEDRSFHFPDFGLRILSGSPVSAAGVFSEYCINSQSTNLLLEGVPFIVEG
jgi:hypothetical protein